MDDSRVVLVTGASSGIGRATALHLAREGFQVFGAARSPGASLPRGESFTMLTLDVRQDRSVRDCVRRVMRESDRIDVLVNCAGVVVAGPAEEMLMEEIEDQVQTNLLGTIRMCRAVLPDMRRRRSGLIITVGSIAGLMGIPFQSAYSASKFALEGYCESLQTEVQSFGIRVVVVDPGDTATEISVHRKTTWGTGELSPYRENLGLALRSQEESEKHGWRVDRLARFIGRIVRSPSPRFRYTPGPVIERISPVARRLIPDRLFLRIVALFYGIRKSAPGEAPRKLSAGRG